jgi:hypothetical protein
MKKKVQVIFLQIQGWSSFLPKKREQNYQQALPCSCITHKKTTIEWLHIQPAMVTLIFAQHNNQPTIEQH